MTDNVALEDARRRHRERSCERKRYFRTRNEAEVAVPNLSMRVYHCEFCHGYHLATVNLA